METAGAGTGIGRPNRYSLRVDIPVALIGNNDIMLR